MLIFCQKIRLLNVRFCYRKDAIYIIGIKQGKKRQRFLFTAKNKYFKSDNNELLIFSHSYATISDFSDTILLKGRKKGKNF